MRVPVESSFMRLKARSNVLLPHPDGPMMAVILCRSMGMFTLATARKSP